MKGLLVAIFAFVGTVAAAQNGFSVSTTADHFLDSGLEVTINYKLPAADPFAHTTNGKAAPVIAYWYWGDATVKEQSETTAVYGMPVKHVYKTPGTYGILVVVIDSKRRDVIQQGIVIKVNKPVEIVQ